MKAIVIQKLAGLRTVTSIEAYQTPLIFRGVFKPKNGAHLLEVPYMKLQRMKIDSFKVKGQSCAL
jgi:hypothetical protein